MFGDPKPPERAAGYGAGTIADLTRRRGGFGASGFGFMGFRGLGLSGVFGVWFLGVSGFRGFGV